jgi:hypothetical protein
MNQFRSMARKVSRNHTKTVWILKCDIRKFFASIDYQIMLRILGVHIRDEQIMNLLQLVINSFHSTEPGKGLPLGNLTSQLLVNIYMNEFDQYTKHRLKARYYIRYADDFIILNTDKNQLKETLSYMIVFLRERLSLQLHPNKVSIATFSSGVDFLGWVHFPQHRVLRTVTKKRMKMKLIETEYMPEVVASYLGLLSHGNAHLLSLGCFVATRKDDDK